MYGDEGYPGVEFLRQPNQVFGLGEQGLNQDPEQADEYRQLYYQGTQTTYGADARLPVQFHGFLRNPGPVPAITFLNLLHAGLQFAHPPHLANLFESQGQGNQPYQDRKSYYGQPHVVETEHVQHHQGVEHGADDYFVPKEKKEFQKDS